VSNAKFHIISKKDQENNKTVFEEVLKKIEVNKKIGMAEKERVHLSQGTFLFLVFTSLFTHLLSCTTGTIFPTFVEVEKQVFGEDKIVKGATRLIVQALSRKDENELERVKKSGHITSKLFRNGLIDILEDVIDDDTKITHYDLSEKVENLLDSPKKIKAKYDPEDGSVEMAYVILSLTSLSPLSHTHTHIHKTGIHP